MSAPADSLPLPIVIFAIYSILFALLTLTDVTLPKATRATVVEQIRPTNVYWDNNRNAGAAWELSLGNGVALLVPESQARSLREGSRVYRQHSRVFQKEVNYLGPEGLPLTPTTSLYRYFFWMPWLLLITAVWVYRTRNRIQSNLTVWVFWFFSLLITITLVALPY